MRFFLKKRMKKVARQFIEKKRRSLSALLNLRRERHRSTTAVNPVIYEPVFK